MSRMRFCAPLAACLKVAALAATLVLAGCAAERPFRSSKPAAPVDDAKPHVGVARAQQLPVHGIDVSKWQGDIDWTAVAAAGTRFAYIKATEGGDVADERFRQNWAGARAAGVARGAYHFVYWCRPAHEQAQWFKMHIPPDPDALPPVLDAEWNGHSPTCGKRIPREEAVAMMRTLLDELEAHTGKRPVIYTDIPFYRDVMADGSFSEYALWVRTVAAEPHEKFPGRSWHFWQYTTTGRMAGIRGNVDRNAFYGSPAAWERFARGEAMPGQVTTAALE
jgi:lysozyme